MAQVIIDATAEKIRRWTIAANLMVNIAASQAARQASRFLDPDNDDALSLTAGWIRDTWTQHNEAAGYDAGFDGGEFSGPAHDRMAHDEVAFLKQHFFNFAGVDFDRAVIDRIGEYAALKLDLLTRD
jgi:hypothetical protein